MTATVLAGAQERTLTVRLDPEEIARYAGVMAVGSGVLAGAGILSVVAYLSAWGVPAPLVRLDPLTATLRSETVIYQVAVLALTVFGLDALGRRLGGRPRARRVAAVAVGLALALLSVDALAAGFLGPVLTIVGGLTILAGHRRGRLGTRGTAVAFAVVALLAAYQTGAESGRLIRDDEVWQTPVTLTTRTPIGGLPGGVEAGDAWQYGDLYLVFRDGEAVYVSQPGMGSVVWIVPAIHVMSLGIGE